MGRRILWAGLLFLLPTFGCQNVSEKLDKVIADIEATKKDLDEKMVTKKDLAEMESRAATKKELDDIKAELLNKLYQESSRLSRDIATVSKTLKKTNEDLASNISATGDAMAVLGEQGAIVGHIARKDGKKNDILSIREMANTSEEFRRDFAGAVQDALPGSQLTSATLRVENTASVGYDLQINGRQWRISPYSNTDYRVPAGWVTTWLVGFESPKTFYVGPPSNFRQLIINPPLSPIVIDWMAAGTQSESIAR